MNNAKFQKKKKKKKLSYEKHQNYYDSFTELTNPVKPYFCRIHTRIGFCDGGCASEVT